jgi:hypothetical protein
MLDRVDSICGGRLFAQAATALDRRVAALSVGVDEQGTWSNKSNVWSARCRVHLSHRS